MILEQLKNILVSAVVPLVSALVPLLSAVVPSVCFVCATVLIVLDKPYGWGWLILIGFLSMIKIERKNNG